MAADEERRVRIAEAVGFLREHLAEEISFRNLAGKSGYSHAGFDVAFKAVTGERPNGFLLHLRIGRAGELLRTTDLPVTEVAYEAGFRDATYFARAFRKIAGAAPSRYRRDSRAGLESRRDEAESEQPGREILSFGTGDSEGRPAWKPLAGHWRIDETGLDGTGDETVAVAVGQALPENFQLEVAFRIEPVAGSKRPPLVLTLRGPEYLRRAYTVVAGPEDDTAMVVSRRNELRLPLPVRCGRFDRPSTAVLEFHDDRLRLAVNGRDVLEFRDPFPCSYPSRSRLAVESWRCRLLITGFRLFDLGLPSAVSPVRIADAFFNEGLYDRAIDFYLRTLRGGADAATGAELRFKIGAAYVEKGLPEQGRSWFEKVAEAGDDAFWADQARLGMLRLPAERRDLEAFAREATEILEKRPALRGEVCRISSEATADLMRRGYYEESQKIAVAMLAESEGEPHWRGELMAGAAESLFLLGRFREAEELWESSLPLARTVTAHAVRSHHGLTMARLFQGRYGQAERATRETARIASDSWVQARAMTDLAVVERSRGRHRRALAILRRTADRCPRVDRLAAWSALEAAALTAVLDGPRNGEARLRRALRSHGKRQDATALRRHLHVPAALSGRIARAATILLRLSSGSRPEGVGDSASLIVAGLLLELARKGEAARRAWKRAAALFPEDRFRGVASVAQSLSNNGVDKTDLASLPYEPADRAEVFFWAAEVLRRRGTRAEALRNYERAVAADPSESWAAIAARKVLRAWAPRSRQREARTEGQ